MCPRSRLKMGIVTLAIICLMHGTSFVFANANDRVQVTNTDIQITEFLFDCHRKKVNWIHPCSQFRRYLMIFDSQGNFFQEITSEINNRTYLSTSFMKTAQKVSDDDMIQGRGYPEYLFQLESMDQNSGSFFIATKSGQLLVAGSEVNPSLFLRQDHCSRWKDVKLLGNSGASTTESSVMIANTTSASVMNSSLTIGSTEHPVTSDISATESSVMISNNTTSASVTNASITMGFTEHPVTSIAISTPGPSLDYSCDQAHWKLWKVDGRFLLIESVSKPNFFLNVESRTHMVRLGTEQEKLTGIETSFIKNITLERTSGRREPGIGDDAYGDLVVHYIGRNGSQQSGYVCDYDWEKESANKMCQYLGTGDYGIPTYGGQYSNKTTPEYVVSGLKCDKANLDDCKFRTVCGSSPSCLTQNSMKAFGGYACNRGSSTDAAGVVCGNLKQTLNVLKSSVTCNSSSLDNDRRSVAAMYTIQHQLKTISISMFPNKHWSQYLLPLPMAVSLMSALLLVSAQNDRAIELVKPDKGYWNHLEHTYLKPNLLALSQNIKNNYILANTNMGVIKQNAIETHENMKLAVQYAFSSDEYEYKTSLPQTLEYITEDADQNKEMANQVHTNFTKTGKIIDELITSLEATNSYQTNKQQDAIDAINQLNYTIIHDQQQYDVNLKKKQEYEVLVDQSRNAFFDAAKKAMKEKCVEGVQKCETGCEFKRAVESCKKWGTQCIKYEKVCVGGTQRDGVLGQLGDVIHGSDCQEEQMQCKEQIPICNEYKYDPPVSGDYCKDSGNYGLCTKCDWTDQVSKNLENVADFSLKLQYSVLKEESSYSGVADVIEDLLMNFEKTNQDVQNYKKWKAATQIVAPIVNAPSSMNNESQPDFLDLLESHIDNANRSMNNESQSSKLERKANRDIDSTLKLTKLSVNMDIDLLSQVKTRIAIKSRNYAIKVRDLLEILITRNVKRVEDMTQEEMIIITTLFTKGKAILKEADKLKEKHEIQIKNNVAPTGAADSETGGLAEKHIDYLSKRFKIEKKIESIANKMRSAIDEMFKQDFVAQDINSIIVKLTKCSRYLDLLSKQWVVLRDFFAKISSFLGEQKKKLERTYHLYKRLEIPVKRNKLGKLFKQGLRTGITENLARNMYAGKIAAFYTKITDNNELPERLASIGLFMNKIKDRVTLDRLKKYIFDEAVMIQEKIKEEISKEEAKINDEVMDDISSIKNDLACKLQNADNESDSYKAGKAIKDIQNEEVKTDKERVNVTQETVNVTQETVNVTKSEPDGEDIVGDLTNLNLWSLP